jgi:CRISPR-associated protein Csd1
MILQALTRYYDILADDPESGIAPPGYSIANVSFALNLSPEGELLNIFPLFDTIQRGKKAMEVPRRMIVPEQVKRASGISPNFLCDNSAYVFGLSTKEAADPEYAVKRFEAFRQWNTKLLAKAQCPEARAVSAFLDAYDPRYGEEHPVIASQLEEIQKGGNLIFKLSGSTGYVHENPVIRRVWETYKSGGGEYVGQCLVTGEIAPIARLHPSLKGVRDANPTGATLVGFNARAYESYNRSGGQGLNSPVSEKAAFAYTTVLNYLLSRENKNRKFSLGDATVVYWAESKDKTYADIFAGLFEPDLAEATAEKEAEKPGRDRKAEQRLKQIAEKVKRGEALDSQSLLEGLNGETRFYVLGLAPNAARVSVRFFHSDPFLKMVQKIMAHYTDLQIVKEFDNQPDMIPVWRILDETVSKKASDKKASPLMAGAVLRAILENRPYPAALYYALINRIRADMDDAKRGIKKINYFRAAIIKAYLTRKYHNQNQTQIQEVLCMALNEQSTNPAYLLGRLFAVLEKAQKEAIPNIDATIKDRYFTSACASPATVFPVLLRLSQHHISKAEYGYANDRRIEEIMNHLEVDKHPFPAHLTLDEQGVFVLGYYHQRAAFFTPKNNKEAADETDSNNQTEKTGDQK